MAKNAKMIKSSDGNKLAIVNPDTAGIDIADTEMQVCVPKDKVKDSKGSVSFGGKSTYGTLIDFACQRCGWTMDVSTHCTAIIPTKVL